jgi:TDG/mug DNA glycosylase family protein
VSAGVSGRALDQRDLPAEALPMALREVHRACDVGDIVVLRLPPRLDPKRLADLVAGAGFGLVAADHQPHRSRRQWRVAAERRRELPDVVGPNMRLLLVGLNPSLYAADAGVGFARPGNRFWPAMLASGLADVDRDPGELLAQHHIGMTDLVKRATVGAAELTTSEYRDGLARVERLCQWLAPGAVCFLGLDGWRRALDRRATAGWQARSIGGTPAYVMPNPSGLNAHATIPVLVDRLLAAAAGPPAPAGDSDRGG